MMIWDYKPGDNSANVSIGQTLMASARPIARITVGWGDESPSGPSPRALGGGQKPRHLSETALFAACSPQFINDYESLCK